MHLEQGRREWSLCSPGSFACLAALVVFVLSVPAAVRAETLSIEQPLTKTVGDPHRGRQVAIDPSLGNCVICHQFPNLPNQMFQGDIGPPLAGVGERLRESELRLRLVDSTRINPRTVMPSYYRIEGLNRVDPALRGKPALNAQQIEDLIAYLLTLTGRQAKE